MNFFGLFGEKNFFENFALDIDQKILYNKYVQ